MTSDIKRVLIHTGYEHLHQLLHSEVLRWSLLAMKMSLFEVRFLRICFDLQEKRRAVVVAIESCQTRVFSKATLRNSEEQ